MTSVLLMDAGFYARKAIPDDPDPQLCLLDSLLVFESRATAEAHLHVLEEAVETEQLCCGLMIHRVPGRDPAPPPGGVWPAAGQPPRRRSATRSPPSTSSSTGWGWLPFRPCRPPERKPDPPARPLIPL